MSWIHPELGDFSETVTLYEPQTTVDTLGGLTPSDPAEAETVPAQVDPRSGQEFLTGAGLVATLPLQIRIPYRTDVDETWLVDWRDRRYQLAAPPRPEGFALRQWLVLSLMVGGPA